MGTTHKHELHLPTGGTAQSLLQNNLAPPAIMDTRRLRCTIDVDAATGWDSVALGATRGVRFFPSSALLRPHETEATPLEAFSSLYSMRTRMATSGSACTLSGVPTKPLTRGSCGTPGFGGVFGTKTPDSLDGFSQSTRKGDEDP